MSVGRATVPNVALFECLARPGDVVAVYWATAAGASARRPDAIRAWRTPTSQRPGLPWTLSFN